MVVDPAPAAAATYCVDPGPAGIVSITAYSVPGPLRRLTPDSKTAGAATAAPAESATRLTPSNKRFVTFTPLLSSFGLFPPHEQEPRHIGYVPPLLICNLEAIERENKKTKMRNYLGSTLLHT